MERIHPLPAVWVKGNASNSERAVHRYEDAYSLTEKTVEDVAERPEVSGKRSGNAEEFTDLRLHQNNLGRRGSFLFADQDRELIG